MHRRPANLDFLKRHVQVRTAATSLKPISLNVQVDSLTTPSVVDSSVPSSGLGKWTPQPSKWAKPEQAKPEQSGTLSAPGKWAKPEPAKPEKPNSRLSTSFATKQTEFKASTRSPWVNRNSTTSLPSNSLGNSSGLAPLIPKESTSKSTSNSFERTSAPHLNMSPKRPSENQSPSTQNLTITTLQHWMPISESLIVQEKPSHRKRDKKFQERSSLLSKLKDNVTIPHRPRVHDSRTSVKSKTHRSDRIIKVNRDVIIPSVVSVGNLARLLNVRLGRLQRAMVKAGMPDQTSHDHMLTAEYASLVAMELNLNPVVNDEAAFDIFPRPLHGEPSTLPLRPPIVTIMGHVDHGKTTLLDTLRSSAVAKGEAGGITQHIGAFSVPVDNKDDGPNTITFLDTPGHAAFSAMRARGAHVTDIVVLVVSADDGIMPQTREVLDLVRQEKLNVVVAINKIDKPGVDVENVQMGLLAEGVQLEVFDGDVPSVPVSGLTGQGLDKLVETISAMAEILDLRSERDGYVQGYVLESNVRKGHGTVATVLITRGCLQPGAHIICGSSHAKVRLMMDSHGHNVKTAYPGMAVTVTGWKTLPNAGDEVLEGTESDVKKAVTNRLKRDEFKATLQDVDAINDQRRLERDRKEENNDAEDVLSEAAQESGPKELRLIVKGDVTGSVEAIVEVLQTIGNKDVSVKVIASGVGDVNESDIMRAQVANASIVAFSVAIQRSIEVEANKNNVPLISSNVIYTVVDRVQARVVDLLPPIIETKVTGEASVLQLFDIHLKAKKTMKVAGCRVINGVINKAKPVRVVRDHKTIYEGQVDTMRHLRKDITEAGKGLECGLSITGFTDLQEGDLIQVYDIIEKPGIL